MIMGSGFLMMTGASMEAGSEPFGKAAVWWLLGAYLLHTIGELCASPVALSFITKLAPMKYASIMMGCYFAATGFGNLLAGKIGEAAQAEPIDVVCAVSDNELKTNFMPIDSAYFVDSNKTFKIYATLTRSEGGGFNLVQLGRENNLNAYFEISEETAWAEGYSDTIVKTAEEMLIAQGEDPERDTLKDPERAIQLNMLGRVKAFRQTTESLAQDDYKDIETMHASFQMERKEGDSFYSGVMVIDEQQNDLEMKTFTFIAIFTTIFGLLLLLFLRRLKALTHNAEEIKD